jgi:hypothetical protein
VTLELTELEADFLTQAVEAEITMSGLVLDHPEAFDPRAVDAVTIKLALLQGILQRLVT